MFTIPRFYKAVGLAALAAAATCSVATPATAQGYISKQGTITGVFASSSENYGFRVVLTNAGNDPLADCTDDFAYLNGSYSNYDVFIAILLSNYHNNRPVNLIIRKDSGGYCQIFETAG